MLSLLAKKEIPNSRKHSSRIEHTQPHHSQTDCESFGQCLWKRIKGPRGASKNWIFVSVTPFVFCYGYLRLRLTFLWDKASYLITFIPRPGHRSVSLAPHNCFCMKPKILPRTTSLWAVFYLENWSEKWSSDRKINRHPGKRPWARMKDHMVMIKDEEKQKTAFHLQNRIVWR